MDFENLGRYQHSLERFRRALDTRRSRLAGLMRLLRAATEQNGDEMPPFDHGKAALLLAEIDELDCEARQYANVANEAAGMIGKPAIPLRKPIDL